MHFSILYIINFFLLLLVTKVQIFLSWVSVPLDLLISSPQQTDKD